MNETQLLTTIQNYSSTALTVTAMSAPIFIEASEFGDKHYYVNIRKVDPTQTLINYENIRYVVVDKGLPGEIAYFYKNVNVQFENMNEG